MTAADAEAVSVVEQWAQGLGMGWTFPFVQRACAAVIAKLATERAAREAAERRADKAGAAILALVKKLDKMEKPLDAAIQISAFHGFPYTGPNWSEEVGAARSILAEKNGSYLDREHELRVAAETSLDRFVDFVTTWCWRESKLTDEERLSAIKYHPTVSARRAAGPLRKPANG